MYSMYSMYHHAMPCHATTYWNFRKEILQYCVSGYADTDADADTDINARLRRLRRLRTMAVFVVQEEEAEGDDDSEGNPCVRREACMYVCRYVARYVCMYACIYMSSHTTLTLTPLGSNPHFSSITHARTHDIGICICM
jgi:hypothetical protein